MNNHGHAQDRRPWLILSRREVTALVAAVRAQPYATADYERALRVIDLQLAYIESGSGAEGNVTETLIREMRT